MVHEEVLVSYIILRIPTTHNTSGLLSGFGYKCEMLTSVAGGYLQHALHVALELRFI
jgi:hypothetical protein